MPDNPSTRPMPCRQPMMKAEGLKAQVGYGRRPGHHGGKLLHSDQGCQFTGGEWQRFLKDQQMICSMSRRGNCHDNAVAESFFQLLKLERVKRKIYPTRDHARADVFDHIELFYNPVRRHGNNQGLSPVEFEKQPRRHGS